jgi:hypothetical protein
LDLGHATAAGRGVRRIQKAVTYFEALGGNPRASRKVTRGLVDSLLGKARDLVTGDGGGLVGPIFDADLGEIKIALLAKGAVDALGQESVPCRVCEESDVATPHPNGSVWTTSFRESHTIHFLYLIPLETIPWQVSCKKADCQLYALAWIRKNGSSGLHWEECDEA